MLDESLSRAERMMLAGSLMGAVLFAFVLWRAEFAAKYFKRYRSGDIVGHIRYAKNDVRKRESQSLTWYQVSNNEELHEQDSLFSGSDSEMAINLLNNESVHLDSNSMIILYTQDNDLLLDLRLGGLKTYVTEAKTIKVKHGSKVAEIKVNPSASPVMIGENIKGEMTISSKSDDVEVKLDQKKVTVTKNQPLILPREAAPVEEAAKQIAPPIPAQWLVPEPINPLQKVVLQFDRKTQARNTASETEGVLNPPHLAWKPVEKAKEYFVEIDKSPEFKQPTTIDHLDSSDFAWKTTQPGHYYWRVGIKGENVKRTVVSNPSQLEVQIPPPLAVIPRSELTTNNDPNQPKKTKKQITVKWNKIPMAKGYRVIAGDFSTTTPEDHLSVTVPFDQPVEFKMAATDEDGKPISDFSSRSYKFDGPPPLPKPQGVLPMNGTTVVAFNGDAIGPLLFNWRPAAGAKSYEVQFSDDPEFKSVLLNKSVPNNRLLLTTQFMNRSIYWRVRANYQAQNSDWSETRTYELQKSTPRPVGQKTTQKK